MQIPLTHAASFALAITLATADLSPPQTIEVDVLWPTGSVSTSQFRDIPLIFAVQNAEAAYSYEWFIEHRLYNASVWAAAGNDSAAIAQIERGSWPEDIDWVDSGLPAWSYNGNPPFNYYYNGDVAVAAAEWLTIYPLDPGDYVILWLYSTENCAEEDILMVAWGTHSFTVDEEGVAGLEVMLDACPEYSGGWTIRDTRDDGCPFVLEQGVSDPDPCRARLQNRQQVECLEDYYRLSSDDTSRNETEACRAAFEVATWPVLTDTYDTTGMFDEDGHAIDSGSGSGSGSGSDDEEGGSDEDVGTSYHVDMSVLGLAATMVMWVAWCL
ncbi:uncharacterized protein BJX67DRAFT_385443 [Aspergillus lucknowensis]|uniref:DUF7136 domain-containing protein n=1 Tax=Aspergillus lucknowensis TaxID=176173 RepID=A0ABR4LDL8_9EURO